MEEIERMINSTTKQTFKDPGIHDGTLDIIKREVKIEAERQEEKHGIQHLTLGEWNLILCEEIGEMQKEMTEVFFAKTMPEFREHMRAAYEESIQAMTLMIKLSTLFKEGGL